MIADLSGAAPQQQQQQQPTAAHCLDVLEGTSPEVFTRIVVDANVVFSCFFLNDDATTTTATTATMCDAETRTQLEAALRDGRIILRLNGGDFSSSSSLVPLLLARAAFLDVSHVIIPAAWLRCKHEDNETTTAVTNIVKRHCIQHARPHLLFQVESEEDLIAYRDWLLRRCGCYNVSVPATEAEMAKAATTITTVFDAAHSQSPMFVAQQVYEMVGLVLSSGLLRKCCTHEQRGISERAKIILFSERVDFFSVQKEDDSMNSPLLHLIVAELLARGSSPLLDLAPFLVSQTSSSSPTSEFSVDGVLSFAESVRSRIVDRATADIGLSIQRRAAVAASSAAVASLQRQQTLAASNDVLQMPLQPLSETLPSSTYSEFERDSVKYERYEEAICRALSSPLSSSSLEREEETGAITAICILGAGRGPLVSCALRQSMQSRQRSGVVVVAVEHSKCAFDVLRMKAQTDELWREASAAGLLHLVHGDGRSVETCSQVWNAVRNSNNNKQTVPLHLLLVSELLGSFGDNELSPECINGFLVSLYVASAATRGEQQQQRDIRVTSIPSRYTSFVVPVLAPVFTRDLLHMSARMTMATQRSSSNTAIVLPAFHIPFVVKATRVWILSSQPLQPVFEFQHPSMLLSEAAVASLAAATNRVARLRFETAAAKREFTGLLGFFTAELFDGVTLSTLPDPTSHTPDMYSWFPIYFPLLPFGELVLFSSSVDENSNRNNFIDVEFTRNSGGGSVFYSWRAGNSQVMNDGGCVFAMAC